MSSKDKVNPSQRACLSCRKLHLKCDARTPVCTRCSSAGTVCLYVESRRGYRAGRKQPGHLEPSAAGAVFEDSPSSNAQHNMLGLTELHFPFEQDPTTLTDETMTTPPRGSDGITADDDYLITIYYQYIHPAHPFILPRSRYLQNRDIFPAHLREAMCFIASHHSSADPEVHRKRSSVVFDPSVPDDGYKVQTLIILTLASYARFERDEGSKALTAAIRLAPRIGLNTNTFAFDQDPVLQESWRRTWWELYTITGLISLIAGFNMRLAQPERMTLPTHCEDYEAGQPFQFATLEAMQQRFATETAFKWSSFAYRIEAMRILRRVLDINSDKIASLSTQVDAASASVSSFLLSIPPEKRDGLKNDGEVDEIMACALMIIHLASICLHFPRSNLASGRAFKTICGTDREKIASEKTRAHGSAALRSAKGLSDLFSSRATLKTVSPCFSCAIAFAAVVQLSECLSHRSPQLNELREYLQLQLSALNALGETWPVARAVKGQLAQFSREVLEEQRRSLQPIASEFWSTPTTSEPAIIDEQWMQDLLSEGFDMPSSGVFFGGPAQ